MTDIRLDDSMLYLNTKFTTPIRATSLDGTLFYGEKVTWSVFTYRTILPIISATLFGTTDTGKDANSDRHARVTHFDGGFTIEWPIGWPEPPAWFTRAASELVAANIPAGVL